MTLILAGCGTQQTTAQKQTPYSIVTGHYDKVVGYLPKTDPVVKDVSDIAQAFTKVILAIDYKTVKGDESYGYLSKDLLNALTSKGYKEGTAKGATDDHLKSF